MRRGTEVIARMPRGGERTGKFVSVVDGGRGQWYVIQPKEKGVPSFKARPSCVRPAP